MIGLEVYKMLVAQLERPVPLPHPVMRRADQAGRRTAEVPRGTAHDASSGLGVQRLSVQG